MLIQLLIIAVAIFSIFISVYIKKSFPALARSLKKEISPEFFTKYSRVFLFLGITGIIIGVFNQLYFSLFYVVVLLLASTAFGIAFSKKI